jgi:tRNA threonylcarbamoyladenosine biosynthesis protein TsaB
MNLLALETSTEMCSVALACHGTVDAIEVEAGQRHSELLNGLIVQILERNRLTRTNLQGIAFGNGPGAFTGLRIACGVAQGLALGLDLRVAPVGTLLALAEQAGRARVITALDARMGETYFAAWEREELGWRAVVEPCLAPPLAVPVPEGTGWCGIGSGFDRQPELRGHLGTGLDEVIAGAFPRAREVAMIGLRIFAEESAVLPEDALPVYLRDKVAFTIAERQARKAGAA